MLVAQSYSYIQHLPVQSDYFRVREPFLANNKAVFSRGSSFEIYGSQMVKRSRAILRWAPFCGCHCSSRLVRNAIMFNFCTFCVLHIAHFTVLHLVLQTINNFVQLTRTYLCCLITAEVLRWEVVANVHENGSYYCHILRDVNFVYFYCIG